MVKEYLKKYVLFPNDWWKAGLVTDKCKGYHITDYEIESKWFGLLKTSKEDKKNIYKS